MPRRLDDGLAARLELGNHSVEQLGPDAQRLQEFLFLFARDAQNMRAPFHQLRVLLAQLGNDRRDHLAQERPVETEQLAMPRRAAQNQPRDIAPPVVARIDPSAIKNATARAWSAMTR